MSASADELAALRIAESVRAAFHEEATLVDAILVQDGYDEAAYFSWLERFSQFTTDAVKRGEFTRAAEQLNLISRLLAAGDEATMRCIDVAYVESLLWDIADDELKREGWKLVPTNLRALYVAMWGEPAFTKGVA